MTDATIQLIVAAIPATIAAVTAAAIAFKNLRETQKVHTLVNSKFSDQLKKTAEALQLLANIMPTHYNLDAARHAKEIVVHHEAGIKVPADVLGTDPATPPGQLNKAPGSSPPPHEMPPR